MAILFYQNDLINPFFSLCFIPFECYGTEEEGYLEIVDSSMGAES